MSKDDYVPVTVEFETLSNKAVMVSSEGENVWIARSCIYGPDEKELHTYTRGDEITLRVFEWLARKEGLI